MNAVRDALLRGRRRAPRRVGGGSPLHYRGDGYEFAEVRAYAAGDDARRIDWAASSRSGELQTRVYLEDVSLTLAALVDHSPAMDLGTHRPARAAAEEAAAAWDAVREPGDRSIALDARLCGEPFTLSGALRAATAVLPRGTALLVVGAVWSFAGIDDPAAFIGARCDCTALVGRDPWYDGIPARGFVTVAQAAGGATHRLWIGDRESERYRAAARAREAAVLAMLQRHGWRAGILDERDGGSSLRRVFGLP